MVIIWIKIYKMSKIIIVQFYFTINFFLRVYMKRVLWSFYIYLLTDSFSTNLNLRNYFLFRDKYENLKLFRVHL